MAIKFLTTILSLASLEEESVSVTEPTHFYVHLDEPEDNQSWLKLGLLQAFRTATVILFMIAGNTT